MATYVMSDIHGQLNSFHSMIDKIGLDKEKDTLYLLGDYVDWGQDGVGVIQQIMKMQKDGFSIKCLMGNHEKMMLDVIDNLVLSGEEYQECVDIWYRNMGEDTHRLMMCLDNKERDNIIAWLRALNITYPITVGGRDYILCHASPWHEDMDVDYMLNARYDPVAFSNAVRDTCPNTTMICGHTIVYDFKSVDDTMKCKIYRCSPYLIYIDCGAKVLGLKRYARLGCLRLDDLAEFYTE